MIELAVYIKISMDSNVFLGYPVCVNHKCVCIIVLRIKATDRLLPGMYGTSFHVLPRKVYISWQLLISEIHMILTTMQSK